VTSAVERLELFQRLSTVFLIHFDETLISPQGRKGAEKGEYKFYWL
jgi:hypothetical protein